MTKGFLREVFFSEWNQWNAVLTDLSAIQASWHVFCAKKVRMRTL